MATSSDSQQPEPAEPAKNVPDTLTSADSPTTKQGSDAKVLSFVGDYRIRQRLGVGSFGEVWMAEAPGGTEVAIKIITRPLSHKEAQKELHALESVKRLRHPYLVQIQAYWILKDQLYIVMELADGSLTDRAGQCRQQGLAGIPVDELLRYFQEAAEAVDYLHSRQVHHRDIKPANILLLGGHAKLADFGLARLLQPQVSLTDATFCGTPSYMPPEVWNGKFSQHSDQWSLAATYAGLRLNGPLFKGTSIPTLMSEICAGQLNLSPLPDAEQQVLRKALATQPHERYGSCKEFVHALEEALFPHQAESEVARGSQAGAAAGAPVGSRLLAWSAVAVLACLVIAIAYCFLNFFGVVDPARIAIEDPPPQQVATGRQATFPLRIRRHNFKGRVGITFMESDLPGHVKILPQEIGAGDCEANVQVSVAQEAAPGIYNIRIRTEGSLAADAILKLTVVYLPSHFETDGEILADGKNIPYYRRIFRPLEGGMRIPFVLIPQKSRLERKNRKVDPDTFYMMQDKVSLGLFRKFAALFPEKVRSTLWNEGTDDHYPVLGMTVEEADRFASLWLRGRLPSTEQWDKAAGRYETSSGEGPYQGRWQDNPKPDIAIHHPAAVGSSRSDVSVFGCRDMAGNGFEWTRTLMGGKGEVPVHNPRLAEHVVYLRGRGFEADEPMRFDDLDETKRPASSMPYLRTQADIGFRVVIEP